MVPDTHGHSADGQMDRVAPSDRSSWTDADWWLGRAAKTVQAISLEQIVHLNLPRMAVAQAKTGDPAGAAATLKIATDAALLIQDLKDRTFALIQVIEAQAETGDFREALRTTSVLEEPCRRSCALRRISYAQAVRGDVTGAQTNAELIEDPVKKALALWCAERVHMENGNRQGALECLARIREVVKEIWDEQWKCLNLSAVALAQIEMGDSGQAKATFEKALEIASSTRQFHDVRADLLRSIAELQMECGFVTDAKRTLLRAIEEVHHESCPYCRPSHFRKLVSTMWRVGMTDSARQMVDEARSTWFASERGADAEGLVLIASAHAEIGDLVECRMTLSQASIRTKGMHDSSEAKDYALLEILRTQVIVARDFEQAFATAMLFNYAEGRLNALLEIAKAQADSGDRSSAAKTLARILEEAFASLESVDRRLPVLCGIARCQAGIGALAGARSTFILARECSSAPDRSLLQTLATLADAQSKVGDPQTAASELHQWYEQAVGTWSGLEVVAFCVGAATGLLERQENSNGAVAVRFWKRFEGFAKGFLSIDDWFELWVE